MKPTFQDDQDDLKAEYEFDYSKARPNRFAERLANARVMVVLDPDVAERFPTTEEVNSALRSLIAASPDSG
jgi:hypothetical protein